MKRVMGIDGGATNTRAIVVDETGQICGVGRGGPSNYHSVGVETMQASLERAIAEAWRASGLEPRPADALFLGLAGIGDEQDRVVVRRFVEAQRFADPARVGIDHDIHITLAGGLAGEPGIAVIAGTGSACYGVNARGESGRAGGWGYLLDDGGSGYQLALAGLRAVIRAEDGRGPATALTALLMQALQVNDHRAIIARLHHGAMPRNEIAAWGRLVCETAAAGDLVAQTILETGAAELALAVGAVARKLGMTDTRCPVTYAGGLLENNRHYRSVFHRALTEAIPLADLVTPRLSPMRGAALLALQSLGIELTPLVRANLGQRD